MGPGTCPPPRHPRAPTRSAKLADGGTRSTVPVAVSFVNMKGGVGKTTLVSQLAFAADHAGFRVLAVDLDPQSNLSHALMGARRWVQHVDQKLPTTVDVMQGYSAATPISGVPTEPRADRLPVSITHHYGALRQLHAALGNATESGGGVLELIPSRLELSRLLKSPSGAERRLSEFLASIADRYDLILIDCAPTESILTPAAYFASRYIVVPVRPAVLATIGLPLLARSVRDFRQSNPDHSLDIAGLVINEPSYYKLGAKASRSEIFAAAKQWGWKVFDTELDHSISYPRAAYAAKPLYDTPNTHGKVKDQFASLTAELLLRVGLRKPVDAPP